MKTKMLVCFALLLACGFGLIVFADDHEEEEMNKLVFSKEAYKPVAVNNGGKISGIVKFEGKVPEKKKIAINKDPKVCDVVEKFDESLVVGEDMALKNTIVYLMDITQGKEFDKDAKVELDQKECRFNPHVQIIPVGTALTVLNNDKATHNVHIFGTKKNRTSINKQQTKNRKRMKLASAKAAEGPVEVKCDIHGWMKAWVAYVPHPYFAVTNEKGEFTLENVPPGEYKLGYWHETCGNNNKEPVVVTIAAGGEVKQDFTLKIKK
ncbi:MAG: carboxypeptidase regulatory-like domain-containing protein [Candidatus Poribacteria bacterium]|nr:carboxypeptidase regulatory-like domain-containing protein [Candidatus Poribacteria bacterium]